MLEVGVLKEPLNLIVSFSHMRITQIPPRPVEVVVVHNLSVMCAVALDRKRYAEWALAAQAGHRGVR